MIRIVNSPTMQDLQAWPATEAGATAEALRRFMLVTARAEEARTAGEADPHLAIAHGALNIAYGANALLLDALMKADPSAADRMAAQIWRSGEDGIEMSRLIHEAMEADGIDAGQIQAAYDRTVDRMAA